MGKGRKNAFVPKSTKPSLKGLWVCVLPTVTLILALVLRFIENYFFKNVGAEVFLSVLFFWALYRPKLLSFLFLILLGLWLDIIETSPLGWTSFMWTLFGFLVWSQRRLLIKAPFGMVWGAFGILVTGVIVMNGLVFSLIYGCPVSLWRLILSSVATMALYPLVFFLLSYLDRHSFNSVPQSPSMAKTSRALQRSRGE